MASPTFAFNLLTESSSNTTTNLPAGFNASIAWLLGQCCEIAYQAYDQDSAPNLTGLTLGPGVGISAANVQGFTASDANGPTSTPGNVGDYTTVPAGFFAIITVSKPPAGVPPKFVVVALRGTQTWEEWVQDAEAYPTFYAGGNSTFATNALAHDGFYSLYTLGSLGATVKSPLDPSYANRAPGSIARQVAANMANTSTSKLPVFVTGHSMGGALAAYCAWDIAAILKPPIAGVSMYSLAAPRCVMGFLADGFGFPVDSFLQGYQAAVPNSFRIVHTCDIAPVLPPSANISNSFLAMTTAHVTDGWSYQGSSGGLTNNVVAFAAQTGDLGGNHSCANTYLPYVTELAAGFVEAPVSKASLH